MVPGRGAQPRLEPVALPLPAGPFPYQDLIDVNAARDRYQFEYELTRPDLDPAFAKYQLIMMCREWYQHPNGALPAHVRDFGDVNPPVHAWAALEVFALDGGRDIDFLSGVFDKLLVNFTWWVNRQDASDKNVFEACRVPAWTTSARSTPHLPAGYTLEQSDATGWMGAYALTMGSIAAVLAGSASASSGSGC